MNLRTLVGVAALLAAGQIYAAPVTPTFDVFGDLPGATFGGAGIPTDPTAITTITSGDDTITLGLTAHQRFLNPPLTNDGAGTFFATTGANDGTPGNPGTAATWNFAWLIEIDGGGTFADYAFSLLYDFDPGVDTDESDLGILDFTAAIVALGGAGAPGLVTLNQDSQNLTFGFLADDSLSFITAPAFGAFSPFASGQYSFALVASSNGTELGRAAINVQVVPAPAALGLLGLGLVGLGVSARRRRPE